MMKKSIFIFALLTLFITACEKYDYNYDSFDDMEDAQEEETGEEGSLTLYKVTNNTITKIKDYKVSSRLLPYQSDIIKHQQMWEHVSKLIPLNDRMKIGEFEIFHGNGELSGFVEPIDDNDLSKWKFGIAIDLSDNLDQINFENLFTYVSLHEFGHILTLNDDQVDVGGKNSCDNYYPGEGCSARNSYINALFELGWKDIIDELDQDNPEKLFNKYKDRFVTDYAASNPAEDIAEVFSIFIMKEREPQGRTVAERKIKLLYQFPELVQLRSRIRDNVNPLGLRSLNIISPKDFGKIRVCRRRGHLH